MWFLVFKSHWRRRGVRGHSEYWAVVQQFKPAPASRAPVWALVAPFPMQALANVSKEAAAVSGPHLCTYAPRREIWMESQLPVYSLPSSSHCCCLGSESTDGIYIFFLFSLSPLLSHSAFHINEINAKKISNVLMKIR